jgi:hypothetical protein
MLSEWLKIMLEEIARKQAALEEGRAVGAERDREHSAPPDDTLPVEPTSS